MKGLFTTVALLILFGSCKESGVQLAKAPTFVRYFSDGNANQAIDMLQTSDNGFLVLAYSRPTSTTGWINLIKTDIYGNSLIEKSIKPLSDASNLQPSNVVAIQSGGADDGYVIVATIQNSSFGSRLFLARVDKNLQLKDTTSFYTKSGNASAYRAGTGAFLIGKGVAQSNNTTSDIFVLAKVVKADLKTPFLDNNGITKDMYLAQINGNTLDTVFTSMYGLLNGTSDLINRLYLDQVSESTVYWGGTRTDGNGIHLRFINAGFTSQITNFDYSYPVGDNSNNLSGSDICRYGYGFGLIGSHVTQVPSPSGGTTLQSDSIVFVSTNSQGIANGPVVYYKMKATQSFGQGNSVCSTLDGGFIILGTVTENGNTDYWLNKVDAMGNTIKSWPEAKTYGGSYPDTGVRVLQSSDGGYVVLGTTTLANVNTVFFMKTDSQGNIQ